MPYVVHRQGLARPVMNEFFEQDLSASTAARKLGNLGGRPSHYIKLYFDNVGEVPKKRGPYRTKKNNTCAVEGCVMQSSGPPQQQCNSPDCTNLVHPFCCSGILFCARNVFVCSECHTFMERPMSLSQMP